MTGSPPISDVTSGMFDPALGLAYRNGPKDGASRKTSPSMSPVRLASSSSTALDDVLPL